MLHFARRLAEREALDPEFREALGRFEGACGGTQPGTDWLDADAAWQRVGEDPAAQLAVAGPFLGVLREWFLRHDRELPPWAQDPLARALFHPVEGWRRPPWVPAGDVDGLGGLYPGGLTRALFSCGRRGCPG